MARSQVQSETAGPAAAVSHVVRLVDPDNPADTGTAAWLHAELFSGIGPIAKLGQRLLQRYCYGYVLRTGMMKAVLIEVEGQPAGLAAYTGDPIELHRAVLGRHLPLVIRETLWALLLKPTLITRLPAAARLVWKRRREQVPPTVGKFAEVVVFGVRAPFRSREFVRRKGLRVPDVLLNFVLAQVRREGFSRVRGVVHASNQPALNFFGVRVSRVKGAHLEPFPSTDQPAVQVWLDLTVHTGERSV